MRWTRSILAMLMVCLGLVVGLAPVHVASAASPYDTAYVTADSLVLRPFDAAQDCTLDVSTNWQRLMSDPGNWGMYFLYEYLYPSFQDALISGSWGVSLGESEYENTTNVTATIFWNSTRGALLQWTEDTVTAPTTGYVSMQAGYNDYTDSCVVIIGMTAGSSGTVVVSGDTSDETRRNFLASYYDPNYPLDYEGETIQSEYRPAYVAMGDSFSSGEGNPPFEYSTDAGGTSENRCHRSPLSYPRLLQGDSSLSLGPTAFVACSGATTTDVLYGDSAEGNWGEGPQVEVLSADTEVVTITVGGNDIKFVDFARACVSGSCSETSDVYEESYAILTDSTRSDYLPDKLTEVYEEIASRLTISNTDAKVLVVGYPYIVTYQGYLDNTATTPSNCVYLTGADATGIESIVDELNYVIEDAVVALNDDRFEFVDPNYTEFPPKPTDTELCSTQSHFNGATLSPNEVYSFHPNTAGQQDYMYLIDDFLP